MKRTSLKRVLCVCLTLCMVFGTFCAIPAFASAPQVTIANNAAGYYTDAQGVKTGALNFTATVIFPEESVLAGYGFQYLPRAIYENEEIAEKPWETVESGLPVSFVSGQTFSIELQDIPEVLFEDEFAVVAYADVDGTRYTSEPAYAKVQGSKDMGTKQTLQADLNGNFTILTVADPQSESWADWTQARTDLENTILRSNPDLVMIQGDITDNSFVTPAAYWDYFVEPLEERDIPWAVINGNHDSFSLVNQRMYESYANCLTTQVDSYDPNFNSSRPVNFVLPVYANDGAKNIFAVWGMDTGTGNSNGYDGVTESQINWYKAESDKLTAANDGETVPGLMALHIPLTETFDMYYDNSDGATYVPKQAGYVYQPIYGVVYNSVDNGYAANDNVRAFTTGHGITVTSNSSGLMSITSEGNNRGLYAAMMEKGDVKITTFGHVHSINFIGNYKGMLLAFTGKIGEYDKMDYLTRGGRVIRFNQSDSDALQVSWVAVLEDSIDQPVIGNDAQPITEGVIADTVKTKNYDAFLDKSVKVSLGADSDVDVTATVDGITLNQVTFTIGGFSADKVQIDGQSSGYSVLAYTGNVDPSQATLIYADRTSDKPTEMKLDVSKLINGELYVKFVADGNEVAASDTIYRFAIMAFNSEGKLITLKPYTTDGASLSASNVASYTIYGGKQVNTAEAIAEGLDVSKAADDSGEFMVRQFRSIVPLN